MKRRTFISSLAAAGAASLSSAAEKKAASDQAKPFEVLSPPVIQNPTDDSFSVAWMISGTATGWVEWGTTKKLGNVVKSAHHGLMGLSDYALSASVTGLPKGASIYYRVVTMPVHYKDAYSIKKGDPILGEIRKLNLPQQTADHCSLAMVSDTHDHEKTVSALATPNQPRCRFMEWRRSQLLQHPTANSSDLSDARTKSGSPLQRGVGIHATPLFHPRQPRCAGASRQSSP